MGYEDSFDNGIEEMSPSKFISFLFKRNFNTTQRLIVQEKNGFSFEEHFYELLSMFPERKLFTLIRQIFRMYASNNKELWEQMILNLLDLNAEMINETLLFDWIRQDVDLFHQRMLILKQFIFNSLAAIRDWNNKTNDSKIIKLKVPMDIFTTLALTSFRDQLTVTNQESLDEHKNEWMKIDIDSMNNLLQLLDEFDGDSQFLIRFAALILVPRKWLRKLSDNSESIDNINIIKVLLLKDLSRNQRVEQASIVILVSNLKQEYLFKLLFINWKLNCNAVIDQLKDYVQDKDSKEGIES